MKGDELLALAEWAKDRCEKLKPDMDKFVIGGGDLDDPQYRLHLGKHQAYMEMRSYVSSALVAQGGE